MLLKIERDTSATGDEPETLHVTRFLKLLDI